MGSGDDNGLGRVLDQIGQSCGSIGHGVCTVTDDEAVIGIIMFPDGGSNFQPVAGLHVRAVNVDKLKRIGLTEFAGIRDIT